MIVHNLVNTDREISAGELRSLGLKPQLTFLGSKNKTVSKAAFHMCIQVDTMKTINTQYTTLRGMNTLLSVLHGR